MPKTIKFVMAAFWILGSAIASGAERPTTTLSLRDSGLSLVRLQSREMSGEGLFFLLDGRLQILTNAHVVQDSLQMQVRARAVDSAFWATVIFNDPVADLAVLNPGLDLQDDQRIRNIAALNFRVCTQEKNGSCSDRPTAPVSRDNAETIMTYNGITVSKIKPQNEYASVPQKVIDQYISGSYPYLWYIRALTRGGVSGGSYYQGDQFAGLVTKVTLGMQAETLAIPAEGIAARLATELRQHPLKDKPLVLASGGGGGGGGGDTGNGGDPTVTSPDVDAHWTLNNMCQMFGCTAHEIANPFWNVEKNSSTLVNGQSAFFFRVGNWIQGHLFQAATQARYNWFKSKGWDLEIYSMSSPDLNERLADLQKKRSEKAMPLRFLRVWKKDTSHSFSEAFPGVGNFGDGVIVLYDRTEGPYKVLSSVTPPLFRGISGQQFWFDLLSEQEDLRFSVAPDLTHLNLTKADRSHQILLKAKPDSNIMKRFFVSDDGNNRAVFIYQEGDLSQLQSMLIETENRLYEFTLTQPNLGFKL